MNTPNIIAIALIALAIGTLLFAVVIGSTPLFMDVQNVLDNAAKIGAPPMPDGQHKLLTAMPWLTSMLLFTIFAIPALLLFAAGYSVWRLVGRRLVAAVEQQISQQIVMEKRLQDGFARTVCPDAIPGRLLQDEVHLLWQRLLPTVDRGRRERILLFGRSLGMAGIESLALSSTATDSTATPSSRKLLLGRITGLLSLLVAAFLALWSIVVALLAPTTEELFQVTLGMEIGTENLWATVAILLTIASIPLSFGLGLLLLSRQESRLLIRWRESRCKAESILTQGFEEQVHRLRELVREPCATDPQFSQALRALIAADFLELSEPNKSVLIDFLHRLGLSYAIPHSAEAPR